MRYMCMTQKNSAAMQTTQKPPRIPLVHGGIQYNSWKNPKCSQFGIPASRTGINSKVKEAQTVFGSGKNYLVLKCNACGEMPPLKSNKGISEEVELLSGHLDMENRLVAFLGFTFRYRWHFPCPTSSRDSEASLAMSSRLTASWSMPLSEQMETKDRTSSGRCSVVPCFSLAVALV